MKLSKSILAALAVGLTLGSATTSCQKMDLKKEFGQHQCTSECGENCPNSEPGPPPPIDNCPACGMG
ncbi:MAG: hypothetical protein KDD43_14650 [Bdellovibrionales bacterium]|nr:hypothetical protein [Bdellovibrionales bacterium]MCB9230955.1 hypothetical protein [Bacteroidia bacterium]